MLDGDIVCACMDRAKDAGADITKEPYTTDYGSRDFEVKDPEGNSWCALMPLGDVSLCKAAWRCVHHTTGCICGTSLL